MDSDGDLADCQIRMTLADHANPLHGIIQGAALTSGESTQRFDGHLNLVACLLAELGYVRTLRARLAHLINEYGPSARGVIANG